MTYSTSLQILHHPVNIFRTKAQSIDNKVMEASKPDALEDFPKRRFRGHGEKRKASTNGECGATSKSIPEGRDGAVFKLWCGRFLRCCLTALQR
ncbi:MAG: hypothetical protein R2788_21150 [Saprospiraceae bacterium]